MTLSEYKQWLMMQVKQENQQAVAYEKSAEFEKAIEHVHKSEAYQWALRMFEGVVYR